MTTDAGLPGAPARRRRIGEVLVEQGLITDEQLQERSPGGAARGAATRKRLGTVVIELGLATERQVAEALAEALGLPLVDLGRAVVVPDHVRCCPAPSPSAAACSSLERSGQPHLGGDVRPHQRARPRRRQALHRRDRAAGRRSRPTARSATTSRASWSLSEDSSDVYTLFEAMGADEVREEEAPAQAVEDAPIVRLVDVVLADAVRARASDVHVEPQAGDLRIRYRVDGLLRDVMTVPRNATAAAVSRIKIVSGLDIAERRRPQDGRAKLTVDGLVVEARISTLPTLHGEKVVIRLLPRAENVPTLDGTGLAPAQLEQLGTALLQPQGLVLITGPTGSGKTNTLYAAIQELSTPERNIVTLEDPVEVQAPGITQVQVNPKSGLTFAAGLRSVLRQDPDVVLVGEVRDHETAELAMQASLTGHLVLTTLHTNDAVAAVTRLVDMGVEPFLVASALSLVVAQRLVRTPCAACAAPYEPDSRTLALLGLRPADLVDATPRRGRGCAECAGTGYRGRVGVFEVLPVTAALRQVLLTTPTEAAIGTAARANGMSTLRASALPPRTSAARRTRRCSARPTSTRSAPRSARAAPAPWARTWSSAPGTAPRCGRTCARSAPARPTRSGAPARGAAPRSAAPPRSRSPRRARGPARRLPPRRPRRRGTGPARAARPPRPAGRPRARRGRAPGRRRDLHDDERGEQRDRQQCGHPAHPVVLEQARRHQPAGELEQRAQRGRPEHRRPGHRRSPSSTATPASSTGTPAGVSGTATSATAAPPRATRRAGRSRTCGASRPRKAAPTAASSPSARVSTTPAPSAPSSVARFHSTYTDAPVAQNAAPAGRRRRRSPSPSTRRSSAARRAPGGGRAAAAGRPGAPRTAGCGCRAAPRPRPPTRPTRLRRARPRARTARRR